MIQVAVLWVISQDGKSLLLAQRANHKAQDPGVWGPAVTGKLEQGETFDAALAREVEEEFSLKPGAYTPHPVHEQDFGHPDGELRKFGIYYTVLTEKEAEAIQIDANEVAGIRWFPIDAVLSTMKVRPHELVPSANAVWPATFKALQTAGALQM